MADQLQPGRVAQRPIEGRADHGLADDRLTTVQETNRDHVHDHALGHGAHVSDKGAAFAGLVVGAVLLGAILFSVVKITNSHYANEKPAAAEAK